MKTPQLNAEHLSAPVAEQALLGRLLLEPEHLDTLDYIEPNHFHHSNHQLIFEHLKNLRHRNATADIIALIEHLRTLNQLDTIGGETTLWTLANDYAGTSGSLANYAHIIREKYLLRQAFLVGRSIMEKAISPDELSLDEKIDWMETQIYGLRTTKKLSSWQSGRQVFSAVMDAMEHASQQDFIGLKTGFTHLDAITLGLRPSQLIILAARPSMGKTTLALNIAAHAAKDHPVLFFSLETPVQDLLLKTISAEQRLPLPDLQKGSLKDHEWHKVMHMSDNTLLDHLFLEEPISLSLHDLRSRIRRFIKEQGRLGLVVVDYLQLMSIQGYNANQRVAEISEISRGLKAIAREFKIPVLALSQLNRELERRVDKHPMMADLRESGSIEQDADLILFIYRDEVYNPETADRNIAEIMIAKHRNGQIGGVRLGFEGRYGRFKNFI